MIETFLNDTINPATREIAPKITEAPARKESFQPRVASTTKETAPAKKRVNAEININPVQQKMECHFSSSPSFLGRRNPTTMTDRKRIAKNTAPNFSASDCQGNNEKHLNDCKIVTSVVFSQKSQRMVLFSTFYKNFRS